MSSVAKSRAPARETEQLAVNSASWSRRMLIDAMLRDCRAEGRRLAATAKAIELVLAGRPVTLVTFDTGQSTRARAAGLFVIKLKKPMGDEPPR